MKGARMTRWQRRERVLPRAGQTDQLVYEFYSLSDEARIALVEAATAPQATSEPETAAESPPTAKRPRSGASSLNEIRTAELATHQLQVADELATNFDPLGDPVGVARCARTCNTCVAG